MPQKSKKQADRLVAGAQKGRIGTCICRYVTGAADASEPGQLPQLAGLALLCAAPATGNSSLVMRVARKSPVMAVKMTW